MTDTDVRSYLLAALRPTVDTDPGATRAKTTTALTVVLPCFNEAERLPATLTAFLAALSAAGQTAARGSRCGPGC